MRVLKFQHRVKLRWKFLYRTGSWHGSDYTYAKTILHWTYNVRLPLDVHERVCDRGLEVLTLKHDLLEGVLHLVHGLVLLHRVFQEAVLVLGSAGLVRFKAFVKFVCPGSLEMCVCAVQNSVYPAQRHISTPVKQEVNCTVILPP